MADYIAVASLDQLPPGHGIVVTVQGLAMVLFNVEDTVYAIDDACRHAGASLGGGALRGPIVRCPAHGWRYDVRTGQALNEPEDRVACFLVQVVDGTILVALD
jgi:nitrite reductase/ring-hydroxylating ferredoxin subunit